MGVYELLKKIFLLELEAVELELISASLESRERKDSESGVSLGVEEFVKITAEVPRGNGALSRLRLDVKIPNGKLKISQEEMEEGIYNVSFVKLEISYIDTGRKNVFFRATDYDLKEAR